MSREYPSTAPPAQGLRVFEKDSKSTIVTTNIVNGTSATNINLKTGYTDSTYPDITDSNYYEEDKTVNNVFVDEGENCTVILSTDDEVDDVWINNQGELNIKSDKSTQYSLNTNGELEFLIP